MDRADHLGQPVIAVTQVGPSDADDLAALRHALWPKGSVAEHQADVLGALETPQRWVGMIARDQDVAIGFGEASIRHDYVNGCESSPVGFLEGIYVAPEFRRAGVARALVAGIEAWVRQHGCTEFASDAAISNIASHRMHEALGFEETQRVVNFRKVLD